MPLEVLTKYEMERTGRHVLGLFSAETRKVPFVNRALEKVEEDSIWEELGERLWNGDQDYVRTFGDKLVYQIEDKLTRDECAEMNWSELRPKIVESWNEFIY